MHRSHAEWGERRDSIRWGYKSSLKDFQWRKRASERQMKMSAEGMWMLYGASSAQMLEKALEREEQTTDYDLIWRL